MKQERKLSAKDSARIQCQTQECEAQAAVCHTIHWDTGNTKGVSFFYYCDTHKTNTRGE